MTSKERMVMAMAHEEPDTVPFMATFVPEVELLLKKRYQEDIRRISEAGQMKYQGMS